MRKFMRPEKIEVEQNGEELRRASPRWGSLGGDAKKYRAREWKARVS
jgi:hypothetical protein